MAARKVPAVPKPPASPPSQSKDVTAPAPVSLENPTTCPALAVCAPIRSAPATDPATIKFKLLTPCSFERPRRVFPPTAPPPFVWQQSLFSSRSVKSHFSDSAPNESNVLRKQEERRQRAQFLEKSSTLQV